MTRVVGSRKNVRITFESEIPSNRDMAKLSPFELDSDVLVGMAYLLLAPLGL